MKSCVYENIVDDYKRLKQQFGVNKMKFIIDFLSKSHNDVVTDYYTMYSLINYEYRKEMKCLFNNSINKTTDQIADEWNENVSILELAEKYNVCAYALLRNIVNKITQSKDISKNWLKDPTLCSDGKLAYEIMMINLHDVMNGVFYNQLSLNSGIIFEVEIRTILEQNNISFMTEDELRSNNYDVTPDFRLNLPLVLVKTKSSMTLYHSDDESIPDFVDNDINRYVITWIECKAVFASVECHLEYYEHQYCSYLNRFGDGIVLYKLGFVEDISSKYSHNLIVSRQMPLISPMKS